MRTVAMSLLAAALVAAGTTIACGARSDRLVPAR